MSAASPLAPAELQPVAEARAVWQRRQRESGSAPLRRAAPANTDLWDLTPPGVCILSRFSKGGAAATEGMRRSWETRLSSITEGDTDLVVNVTDESPSPGP